MKKSYILIALAMVAALTTVSCKCTSKKSQEPTQEEIQAKKQALADTVLAKIDEFAEQYWENTSKSFRFRTLQLTDAEKMVKPDYLLDPSVANNLVTKSQKINALAIYDVEQGIRKIYDMPCNDVEEVIAKLIVDLNAPLNNEDLLSESPVSEKIKAYYDACKERGDVALFWQFEEAVGTEINYLLSQDPDLFFSKMTEEQWQNYYKGRCFCFWAVDELAKYDEEMAELQEFMHKEWTISDDDESNRLNATIASVKEYRAARKDLFIAKRNALLQ